jgi:misacylated tRNA(Ala) deacylase
VTRPIYLDDSYCHTAEGQVIQITESSGIVLADSLFYPTGGGQPGDRGRLIWAGGSVDIETTVKGEDGKAVLVPMGSMSGLEVGQVVTQMIDWTRRLGHMRVHTALHLLSVVIPLPVSGGSVAAEKGRLDFDMAEPPADKDALEAEMNALIGRDLQVAQTWISPAELDANPGLVKTMSVQPPRDAGPVRLVRIGSEEAPVDLQPCGGTHVSSTGQIGPVRIGKIEKKGARNRRVYLHLDDVRARRDAGM